MSTTQNPQTHLARMNRAVPLRVITGVFDRRWWLQLWERLRTFARQLMQPRLPAVPDPGELEEVPAIEVAPPASVEVHQAEDPFKGTIHETSTTEVVHDMRKLLSQLNTVSANIEVYKPVDIVASVTVPAATKQIRISPCYRRSPRTVKRYLHWRKTGPGMIMPWDKMEMISVRPEYGEIYPVSFPIAKLGLKEGDSAEFGVSHDVPDVMLRLSVEFLFL